MANEYEQACADRDYWREKAASAIGALEMVKSDGDFDQLHEVTRGAVTDATKKDTP